MKPLRPAHPTDKRSRNAKAAAIRLLVAGSFACLAFFIAPVSTAAEPQRLHWLNQSGILTLMDGDRIVWSLRHGKDNAKPFFYPINALDGTGLARYQPASEEHPWHRGLWFSFKYINGVNYWEEDRATLVSEGVSELLASALDAADDHSATIELKLAYHEKGGPPLLTETREIEVSAPDADGSYFFDWSSHFTAQEDISLARTPLIGEPDGKSWGGYAGLSFRFPHELRSQWRFTTSDSDQREGGSHGSRNRWAYYGGDSAGVAIFDEPGNSADGLTPWYLDAHMPFMSPAFLFDSEREVKKGESWTLRYRIKVYSKLATRAQLEADYQSFTAEKIDLVATGKQLFQENSCIECHSTDPDDASFKTGPNLYGLFQAAPREHQVLKPDGQRITVQADSHYLAESLLDPAALIAIRESGEEKGSPYPAAMPPYPRIGTQGHEAIAAYLKTLNPAEKRGPMEDWRAPEPTVESDKLNAETWVGRQAVVARTPILGSSTRSIHLGLPNQANYTFDTVNLAVNRFWWGGFIDASADRDQRAEPGIGTFAKRTSIWPTSRPLLTPLDTRGQAVDFSFKSWPVLPSGEELHAYFEAQRVIDAEVPYLDQAAAVDAEFLGIERRDQSAPSLRFRIGSASYTQTTRIDDDGAITFEFETTGAQKPLLFAIDQAAIEGLATSAGSLRDGLWRVPADQAKAFSVTLTPKHVPAKPPLPERVETHDRQPLVWTTDDDTSLPHGYRSESASLPKDRFGREQLFEPLGIAFAANGTAVVASRTAGVWRIQDDEWRFFADGLYDPLSVWIEDGQGDTIVVGQKPELTRLRDSDGDGYADRFDTINDTWRLAGNYCEYVHGPVRDEQGNYYFNLNLAVAGFKAGGQYMGSLGGYDGWTARVTPQGAFEPWASGLRSPAGIGWGPAGRLLYTENQGSYVGTSKLFSVEAGAYYGYPASLIDHPEYRGKSLDDWREINKWAALPLVYLPHGLVANSPGNPVVENSAGKFGPFAGQILIGDQTLSNVSRVTLQEVDGIWQGAAMPFLSGFESGAMRLALSPEGHLWIGQTGRGWASKGGQLDALQRVIWDGASQPFEIETARITPDGFALSFTDAIDAEFLDAQGFTVESWFYEDTQAYGSPRHDLRSHEVISAALDSSGRVIHLKIADMSPARIYGIDASETLSAAGLKPTEGTAYYTAHRLPRKQQQ